MKIDVETLINSLNNLKITEDISWREMERQSGVFNISRIVSGEIKKPTAESWWQLHRAFPRHIPEPSYLDGTKIYKNVTASNHSHAAGRNMEITNNHHSSGLSPEEQTLINLLREKDPSRIYLRRCIAELIMREDAV